MQKALLVQLQEIAPNLTTYQAGSVAAAQIISDGNYVLKDAREIKKFQADLNYFIEGTDPKKTRITSLDDISADMVKELRKYLENKGYQQINIQADLKARDLNDSPATRQAVANLSRPSL
ncbi:MAG: hypothetical protein VKK32_06405 [Candidatus Melainabacteria bacterium]|nr:hypothetical protein [Candidatus Melainabacteria bacterium]